MSCITRTAKYVILAINYSFVPGALALIVLGIIYLLNEESKAKIFGDVFYFDIAAICIGVLTMFLSAVAWFGALHQNTRLLTMYAVVLIAHLMVQLAFGIFAVTKIFNYDGFFSDIKDMLEDLFNKMDGDSVTSFHNIQKRFECCGVDGFWNYNLTAAGYDITCCDHLRDPCFQPFDEGCASAYTNRMREYIVIIACIAISFAVIEIAGAIFAFMVRQENIRNELRVNKRSSAEEIDEVRQENNRNELRVNKRPPTVEIDEVRQENNRNELRVNKRPPSEKIDKVRQENNRNDLRVDEKPSGEETDEETSI